jgi:hypothetical protein
MSALFRLMPSECLKRCDRHLLKSSQLPASDNSLYMDPEYPEAFPA